MFVQVCPAVYAFLSPKCVQARFLLLCQRVHWFQCAFMICFSTKVMYPSFFRYDTCKHDFCHHASAHIIFWTVTIHATQKHHAITSRRAHGSESGWGIRFRTDFFSFPSNYHEVGAGCVFSYTISYSQTSHSFFMFHKKDSSSTFESADSFHLRINFHWGGFSAYSFRGDSLKKI